jgi:murein DD-endopeptidase MepM/ murein hydrolase activator NlpD
LWNHDFKDSRIIFEREDELQYYYITANVQKKTARVGIMLVLSIATMFFLLIVINAFHMLRYSELEHNKFKTDAMNRKAMQALADVMHQDTIDVASLNQEELLAEARRQKQNQKNVLLLVDFAQREMNKANYLLTKTLNSVGVSKGHVDKLMSRADKSLGGQGGLDRTLDIDPPDAKSKNALIKEIQLNEQIKSIYKAIPVSKPINNSGVSSNFGVRVHPLTGKLSFHDGVDFIPHNDTMAKSTAAGVVDVGYSNLGYGNVVTVHHAFGFKTLYGHLSKILVKPGQKIEAGTVVGIVGNTGSSTGTHLHYEIAIDNDKLNPLLAMELAKNVQ